jgi:hypothetical protein
MKPIHWKTIAQSLPIWIIALDLMYSVAHSLYAAFTSNTWKHAFNTLSFTPELALIWFPVLTNLCMVLLILWAIRRTWTIKRLLDNGQCFHSTILNILAIFIVLAFSLPSIWLWFWTAISLLQGHLTLDTQQPRYLAIAICQPYLAWFILAICCKR